MKSESSQQTIRRFLSAYQLGKRLNQLRLRKKIALADLGRHSGLSPSLLSQIENGKIVPTLPTLSRIAMVFDVGLDYFFIDPRRRKVFSIVRSMERIQFPQERSGDNPAYFFEHLNFHVQDKALQGYLAEFPEREEAKDLHFHEGHEFLYVLKGKLEIHYQDEDHTLEAGDSAYFDSSEPHGYRGLAGEGTAAVVIVTPPRL